MGRGTRELEAMRQLGAAGQVRPGSGPGSCAGLTHRTTRTLAASVLLAGLLLAGCSGKADDTTPAPSAGSPESGVANPSSTPVAPATTPVAPPTSGSTKSSVPSKKVTKRKAVSLDGSGEAADGVTVSLTKVKAITAKAVGPGEVSGPGVAITVSIANGTSQPLDVGSVVVNLTAADDSPGAQMTGSPARSFSGSLKAGAKASGVYVYALGKGKRDPVTVEVTVSPADPVVVFRGRAAS
ncbi:hypothetical protein [uncultured Friedmanniella sp.]|uniref:hypothetical protein n=1 Tax=uncultured Friedmanniella sp. TaxID=335381 RepID=UPI0035C9EBD7